MADGLSVVLSRIIWRGRRHTDVRCGHRMQDERPYRPTKKASGCFACVSFLTVVDTYMQPDLPEVYHGGHAEMENKMWGAKKNVTSLHEILCFLLYIFLFFFLQYMCVCVCGAAGLTGQRRVVHPEGAACSQLPEGSAARWQDSATAPPCESEPTLQPFHVRVCVCVCVSWRVYNRVSNSTFPPRLHSWLGVRTHIKTRCQTTGLIYPRGLIQFVCKSFVLFARLPDYVERKIAKKNKKKNPQQPHTCSLAALQRRGPWFAAARGAGGGTAAGKQSSPPPDLARANTRPRLPHLPLCPSPGKMRASERQKERKRIFSESFFHWNNEQATSPSEPPPPKSCVIYWCLSTQNLRSTIRSQTNRWSQPEKIP